MSAQFCYHCERYNYEPDTSDLQLYSKFWQERVCFHCNSKFISFFEVPVRSEDGYCNDNECPCDGVKIPRGTGYLFIPKDTVDIRKDLRNASTFQERMNDLERKTNSQVVFDWGVILMCEKGARLRGLKLQIAAKDARIWWKTGLVPLRSTPLLTTKHINYKSNLTESYRQNPAGKIWIRMGYKRDGGSFGNNS